MEIRKFYVASFIIAQIFLMGRPTSGIEQGEDTSSQPGQTAMLDTMEKILNEAARSDEGISKRVQKRIDARQIQKTGEKLEKKINNTTKPLRGMGTSAGLLASATGDPTIKMATAIFKLSVTAVEGLGKGIAIIMTSVGRYQERSQEILSITEVLVESIQKSIEKIKALRKKQQSLLDIDPVPEPSKSSSRLKQFGKNLYNAPATIQSKVGRKLQQVTDVVTNDKAGREEKLKAIRLALKEENENFAETVRLFQIKLLQDAVKEIDKKINIDDTIKILKNDISFYEKAKENISGNKSQGKKQLADIDKKLSKASQDLKYYEDFQKSPTEPLEVLQKNKSSLVNQIGQLTKLTKLADSLYLQDKGIDPSESQLDKATIVGLYKELDSIKSQIEALKKGSSSPTAPSLRPPLPSPPSVTGPAKGRPGNLQRVLPSRP